MYLSPSSVLLRSSQQLFDRLPGLRDARLAPSEEGNRRVDAGKHLSMLSERLTYTREVFPIALTMKINGTLWCPAEDSQTEGGDHMVDGTWKAAKIAWHEACDAERTKEFMEMLESMKAAAAENERRQERGRLFANFLQLSYARMAKRQQAEAEKCSATTFIPFPTPGFEEGSCYSTSSSSDESTATSPRSSLETPPSSVNQTPTESYIQPNFKYSFPVVPYDPNKENWLDEWERVKGDARCIDDPITGSP